VAVKEETALGRKRRARRMARELAEIHPDAHCELDFTNPLELVVATILSAQTTDVRVNEVTPKLFAKFRTAADYAGADRAELEELLKPTGFFRNKTDSVIKLGQALVERFDGEVPRTLDELIRLPGVARKTANVVASELGDTQGIVVDTHVRRLSQRLGLTKQDDPVKIERDLQRLVPREYWGAFPHLLIWHGRRVCIARRPRCEECVVRDLCPSSRV
jgi:endonuclease III